MSLAVAPSAAPSRGDFVLDFLAMTAGQRSPLLFRKWAAISCVAAALERRVWARTNGGAIYPNLYVLLVAPPGVGKFVIEITKDLMVGVKEPGTKLPAFKLASDSVSNASLMDELNAAKSIRILKSGPPYTYHSLFAVAEEFQVILPTFDPQLIASLNSIYNNKSSYTESRRTGSVRKLDIENPQLNLLAGAQPAYFISTFPEEAWSTGLIRRIVMIYSTEAETRSLWEQLPEIGNAQQRCGGALAEMSQLFGQMKWTPEAAEAIDRWQLGGPAGAGGLPVPSHSKLQHYVRSRTVLAVKLAMVSAVSRTGALVIEPTDVTRGIEWLLEAESAMPDIFREMVGKSDSQVIEEMYLFVMSLWARQRQQPVPGSKIMRFLLERTPSDKAKRIMEAAEAAGIIARCAGTMDLYVPKPREQDATIE